VGCNGDDSAEGNCTAGNDLRNGFKELRYSKITDEKFKAQLRQYLKFTIITGEG